MCSVVQYNYSGYYSGSAWRASELCCQLQYDRFPSPEPSIDFPFAKIPRVAHVTPRLGVWNAFCNSFVKSWLTLCVCVF